MKIHKIPTYTREHWLKTPFSSHEYRTWLLDNRSLTARLQRRYLDFSVHSLAVKYSKPIQDEASLLRIASGDTALIREVLLMGNSRPAVFAHSVLPRRSLRGEWQGLGRLGNKPLGATLFANPKVKRTPLSYKKLSPNQWLYHSATRYLTDKPAFLWARRSIFSLNRANIMVTEVFLPHIIVAT